MTSLFFSQLEYITRYISYHASWPDGVGKESREHKFDDDLRNDNELRNDDELRMRIENGLTMNWGLWTNWGIDVQLRIDGELAIYDEVGTQENWGLRIKNGLTMNWGFTLGINHILYMDCKLTANCPDALSARGAVTERLCDRMTMRQNDNTREQREEWECHRSTWGLTAVWDSSSDIQHRKDVQCMPNTSHSNITLPSPWMDRELLSKGLCNQGQVEVLHPVYVHSWKFSSGPGIC